MESTNFNRECGHLPSVRNFNWATEFRSGKGARTFEIKLK